MLYNIIFISGKQHDDSIFVYLDGYILYVVNAFKKNMTRCALLRKSALINGDNGLQQENAGRETRGWLLQEASIEVSRRKGPRRRFPSWN